ncbi:hypothetical protein L2E82_32876 [Cichorium intybus]|uniref:Uncharacterized protein n=1 Tax=Cichorium intybus TaxID=13427 RepID=A0ACB9BIA5_CICIN|nr:hypothetical protein L2E82_32876 [Cichorium intybus]
MNLQIFDTETDVSILSLWLRNRAQQTTIEILLPSINQFSTLRHPHFICKSTTYTHLHSLLCFSFSFSICHTFIFIAFFFFCFNNNTDFLGFCIPKCIETGNTASEVILIISHGNVFRNLNESCISI